MERLRAAGAVIIGKTTTPVTAMLGRTEQPLSGITRSPGSRADPRRIVGVASVVVAAGVAPLAIGTAMGGSTRLPASYTGLVGCGPRPGAFPGGRVSGHLYRFQ